MEGGQVVRAGLFFCKFHDDGAGCEKAHQYICQAPG